LLAKEGLLGPSSFCTPESLKLVKLWVGYVCFFKEGADMAVRFIIGRAGKGKSHLIFKEIADDLKNDNGYKLILLVPEQFTLQAERDLIAKMKLPGIMRAEVLSFTRLARRVFEEAGGATKTLINEQGKHMVLRKVMNECAGELGVYRRASKQPGFVAKFGELLSEMKREGVLPEDLRKVLPEMGEYEVSKQKLNDISLIYERFNQYLKDRYIDTEDYINLLIGKVEDANFLRGARIWVDGFASFSSQNLRLIEKLMLMAQEITFSLTIDPEENKRDRDLFSLPRATFAKIDGLARRHGLKTEVIPLKQGKAAKKKELLHLESELYAYPPKQMDADISGIDLFAAANPVSEIENMAAQVVSLVRDKGYRWRDIAVVCNDMENYGGLIKRSFVEHDIPFFIDQKRDIVNNPIICLILSALEIVQKGYKYEDVFSFLKTGLSDISPDECELLENYVLRYGIEGNRWKKDFSLGEKELSEDLNLCREKFVKPLENLTRKVKGKKTFAEITRALHEYLKTMEIPDKLAGQIEMFRNQGLYELVNENTQIWNIVMEVFDQMGGILGEQQVSIGEYKKILQAGFMSYEIGIIPTTVDQVLVGNIQRSRSHDIRALFVVGANDGVLPSRMNEIGLLTGEEKEFLRAKGLELGLDLEMKSAEEKFLIYNTLTKPSDYLWLSFSLADREGRAMYPSLLVDRFKKLFKRLAVRSDLTESRQAQLRLISTPKSTFKYLVKNLRLYLDEKPISDIWWDVYGWYCEQEDWSDAVSSIIEGFFHQNQPGDKGYIKREQAEKLYGLPLYAGVSRLEQFAACPFAHFVRYGLKPQERKEFAVKAPDVGEFLHNCLFSFAAELAERRIEWRQLQKEECEAIMDKVVQEAVPVYGDGVMVSSYRYKHLAERLKRISTKAAWMVVQHVKKGEFNPRYYEVSFGRKGEFPPIEVELADGEKMYLEGRIDRVDFLAGEEADYIRIIDYKSGSQEFNLSDVYYGLAMQLLVYLQAVLKSRNPGKRELKPAGLFYFKIDDPLIETDQEVVEVIEREMRKQFKMKGLVLKDVEIVRRMDCDLERYSEVIPVAMNKDGNFHKKSSVLEEPEIEALICHVENLLQEIGGEIMKGKIKIEPVNTGKFKYCGYCSYRPVCQFDKLFGDNDYKNIRQLQKEEVIARIRGGTADVGLD